MRTKNTTGGGITKQNCLESQSEGANPLHYALNHKTDPWESRTEGFRRSLGTQCWMGTGEWKIPYMAKTCYSQMKLRKFFCPEVLLLPFPPVSGCKIIRDFLSSVISRIPQIPSVMVLNLGEISFQKTWWKTSCIEVKMRNPIHPWRIKSGLNSFHHYQLKAI